MADAGLPEAVRELVRRDLASMTHLDVLLLLYRSPDREWTPADAAGQLQGTVETVGHALRDLDRSGLTVRGPGGGHRYAPERPEARATVEMLADTYNRFPVQLIRAIYERPADPVQSVADAFRLKGS